MSKDILISALILAILMGIGASADVTNRPGPEMIYYEKEGKLFTFTAPDKWKFDLENAQREGYSALIIPDSSSYYKFDMIIYIWIYQLQGAGSYRDFISKDSLRLLKENPKMKFALTDSVYYDTLHYSVYLETAEPGTSYDIAFVGYIISGAEIIIYQCDIRNPFYFDEAQARFREALSRFKVTERE